MKKSKKDFMWLVGFYEGEGSCGFYNRYNHNRKHGYPSLRASIAQKDENICMWIKSFLGYGQAYRIQDDNYRWCCATANARNFLTSIKPFIKIDYKLNQITEALNHDKKEINA